MGREVPEIKVGKPPSEKGKAPKVPGAGEQEPLNVTVERKPVKREDRNVNITDGGLLGTKEGPNGGVVSAKGTGIRRAPEIPKDTLRGEIIELLDTYISRDIDHVRGEIEEMLKEVNASLSEEHAVDQPIEVIQLKEVIVALQNSIERLDERVEEEKIQKLNDRITIIGDLISALPDEMQEKDKIGKIVEQLIDINNRIQKKIDLNALDKNS